MWHRTNNNELINLRHISKISIKDNVIRLDEPGYMEDYISHYDTFETEDKAKAKFNILEHLLATR